MTSHAFDVAKVRKEFPALNQKIYGRPLVYLDNAATTQKPKTVIETLEQYYTSENANIHRGIYYLSQQATNAYEGARGRVREFLNARSNEEIIFVRGATEGINLVAHSYGRCHLKAGDEIVISAMEHHSNIVPWQMLSEEKGARLRIVPINDQGEILMEEYEKLLNEKTKLVSVTSVSNVIGTINPVKEMIGLAHRKGIPVLVDAAQAVPHLKVDVEDLDCDFLVFSGHKMFAPTGIGVLYGKSEHLEAMPPYQGGGDMISSVTFEKTVYNQIPYKFEAGTPHIAGVIGLGRAIDFLNEIGIEEIAAYEEGLLRYATKALTAVPGLQLIGTARKRSAIVSFVMNDVHPHDIGTILDHEGVAIRAGHHCAMPLMQRFGVPATARASFAFYNTTDDVDALTRALGKVSEVFQ